MSLQKSSIAAQACMHHAYFLGLQLMVATNKEPAITGDWMFRLFRRQHREKFLSSFNKLGLEGLPDAVACAQYHVLSNSIGGVPVEYMAESDSKAWVRFRYPRWMYHGPTICGVPVEVSRGFLYGWYAENGVSLKNPRLGFVCVSVDMTGEFGFCGYFKAYDHELTEEQRLQFDHSELPPSFKASEQPHVASREWSAERLEKANRNYAIDYIRNGLIELKEVLGEAEALELGARAARLIGLQYLQETRGMLALEDADLKSALDYLQAMFAGLGDSSVIVSNSKSAATGRHEIELLHSNLRIVRGLEGGNRDFVLSCWHQLWLGALSSYRQMKTAQVQITEDRINWIISDRV